MRNVSLNSFIPSHPSYSENKDKPSYFPKLHMTNSLSYENCLLINNLNIDNYKTNSALIAYSEEPYTQSDDNFYPPRINYTALINIINVTAPYPNTSSKIFTYTNYIPDNNILFSSKFESGNWKLAIKHSETEYDLIIRPDTSSVRSFQWFYFSVKLNSSNKTSHATQIKFNIINLIKNKILLNNHVHVLAYYNNYWSRDTSNIHYYPNSIDSIVPNIQYNTWTFTFDFALSPDQEVFFSYCYPYTFTYLNIFLNTLWSNSNNTFIKRHWRYETIGKSENNKNINMLIITDFSDSFEDIAKRSCIMITGRVHPGESNSSYAVEGWIQFLWNDNHSSNMLLKQYVFKIIPMLNPDGVIAGNFRMNLKGKDLNRMWIDSTMEDSPTISHVKEVIVKTWKTRDIYWFCDFHGHSNKHNFFWYSCKIQPDWNNLKKPTKVNHEQIFPYVFNKENLNFDKRNCVGKINPSKIKTARAVLKNEFGVDFSYCLESSMASIQLKNGDILPFTIELYKKIGKDFLISLCKMIDNKFYYNCLSVLRNEQEKERSKNKVRSSKKQGKKKHIKGNNRNLPLLSNCGFSFSSIRENRSNTNFIPNINAKDNIIYSTRSFPNTPLLINNNGKYNWNMSVAPNNHLWVGGENILCEINNWLC